MHCTSPQVLIWCLCFASPLGLHRSIAVSRCNGKLYNLCDVSNSGKDVRLTERGIIYIDEIDKIARYLGDFAI